MSICKYNNIIIVKMAVQPIRPYWYTYIKEAFYNNTGTEIKIYKRNSKKF